MSIAPEQQLINEQYVQLLQRSSLTWTQGLTILAAASDTAAQFNGNNTAIGVDTGKAARIVYATAQLYDQTGSNKLTVNDASLMVFGQGSTGGPLITATAYPASSFALSANGIVLSLGSNELIYYNDYVEVGGIPPGFEFNVYATISNSDAVNNHVAKCVFFALVEFYLLTTGGRVGYTP